MEWDFGLTQALYLSKVVCFGLILDITGSPGNGVTGVGVGFPFGLAASGPVNAQHYRWGWLGLQDRIDPGRLDHDAVISPVDLKDLAHPREHDQQAVCDRQRAAGEPGARPPRNPWRGRGVAKAQDLADLFNRSRQDGDRRRHPDVR